MCKKPTRRLRIAALIDEAIQVEREDAYKADSIGYMAPALAQVTLPHKSQGESLYYERTNGKLTLAIRGHKSYGLPFGTIPRVILAWISSEAVRTKSPELFLGRSAAEFSKKLSLHYNGHDLSRLKKQCLALSRALISIDHEVEKSLRFEDIKIVRSGLIFWEKDIEATTSLWENTITLTEDFYSAIASSSVPLDLRVYFALKKSPLAMDIYCWLTYRMFLLQVSRKSRVLIPWEYLKAQFASGYSDDEQGLRDFKKAFLRRLREVLLFYTEAQGHVSDNGKHLALTPCRPHVLPTEKK
ncbi:hypothetical protein DB032_09515 [Chromobacterium sp. Panama]|uniref:replication protein RepA n=1 Tax=Chromobacterium sp. Panama TaxID=2161826 RepID=UPI000D2F4E7C|nr:replication protein RepA [Chromobacterium sp. Panama]PTU65148.1 hypothetical protein DB032_09515 [Chromobacterium sp. Panama]